MLQKVPPGSAPIQLGFPGLAMRLQQQGAPHTRQVTATFSSSNRGRTRVGPTRARSWQCTGAWGAAALASPHPPHQDPLLQCSHLWGRARPLPGTAPHNRGQGRGRARQQGLGLADGSKGGRAQVAQLRCLLFPRDRCEPGGLENPALAPPARGSGHCPMHGAGRRASPAPSPCCPLHRHYLRAQGRAAHVGGGRGRAGWCWGQGCCWPWCSGWWLVLSRVSPDRMQSPAAASVRGDGDWRGCQGYRRWCELGAGLSQPGVGAVRAIPRPEISKTVPGFARAGLPLTSFSASCRAEGQDHLLPGPAGDTGRAGHPRCARDQRRTRVPGAPR